MQVLNFLVTFLLLTTHAALYFKVDTFYLKTSGVSRTMIKGLLEIEIFFLEFNDGIA